MVRAGHRRVACLGSTVSGNRLRSFASWTGDSAAGCQDQLEDVFARTPRRCCWPSAGASSRHGHLGAVGPFVAQAFEGKCLRAQRKLGSLGGHVVSFPPHTVRRGASRAGSALHQHRERTSDSTLCSKEPGPASFSLRLPEPREEASFWGAPLDPSACQASRPLPPSCIQTCFLSPATPRAPPAAWRFGRTLCSHGVQILARESRRETSK